MKKSIALLCLALSATAGAPAHAADDGVASCTQLSSDIAAQGALFRQVATTGLERSADQERALHDIANEIWSLRTRMAYLGCAQAESFTY